MSKIAVIYWSGTGNTEIMANAIAKGANADIFDVASFSGNIDDYDKVAFGCSAMGDEELEDSEFAPFYDGIEAKLKGKKVAIFGSYGWGDGEWIRLWADRVKNSGAILFREGLIINETPDAVGVSSCEEYGKAFAGF